MPAPPIADRVRRRLGAAVRALAVGGVAGLLALVAPPVSAANVTALAADEVGDDPDDGGSLAAFLHDLLACGAERPPRPDGGSYRCTFEEAFDGDALDTDTWVVQGTVFSAMTSGNDDCFVRSADNLTVDDGVLHLTARMTAAPFTCPSPRGAFTANSTAAAVSTRNSFSQAYGRFAFRARFPGTTAPGVHSALWLYPGTHPYGPWPRSGEIDVAEWFSSNHANVYPSLHYAGEDRSSTGWNCSVPTANSEFHDYAVEWTPERMRFYYDDELCFEHSWTPAPPLRAPQPFDQPFNFVLTQVYGGGSNAVTTATPRTATMEVDWVRAWE